MLARAMAGLFITTFTTIAASRCPLLALEHAPTRTIALSGFEQDQPRQN